MPSGSGTAHIAAVTILLSGVPYAFASANLTGLPDGKVTVYATSSGVTWSAGQISRDANTVPLWELTFFNGVGQGWRDLRSIGGITTPNINTPTYSAPTFSSSTVGSITDVSPGLTVKIPITTAFTNVPQDKLASRVKWWFRKYTGANDPWTFFADQMLTGLPNPAASQSLTQYFTDMQNGTNYDFGASFATLGDVEGPIVVVNSNVAASPVAITGAALPSMPSGFAFTAAQSGVGYGAITSGAGQLNFTCTLTVSNYGTGSPALSTWVDHLSIDAQDDTGAWAEVGQTPYAASSSLGTVWPVNVTLGAGRAWPIRVRLVAVNPGSQIASAMIFTTTAQFVGGGSMLSLPAGFAYTSSIDSPGSYVGANGSVSHFHSLLTVTQTAGGGTPAQFLDSIDVFYSPTGQSRWALGQHIVTNTFTGPVGGKFNLDLGLPYGVSCDIALRINSVNPSSATAITNTGFGPTDPSQTQIGGGGLKGGDPGDSRPILGTDPYTGVSTIDRDFTHGSLTERILSDKTLKVDGVTGPVSGNLPQPNHDPGYQAQIAGTFLGMTVDSSGRWSFGSQQIFPSTLAASLPIVGQIATYEATFQFAGGGASSLAGCGLSLFTNSGGSNAFTQGYYAQFEGDNQIHIYRRTSNSDTDIHDSFVSTVLVTDGASHTLKVIVAYTSAGRIDFTCYVDGHLLTTGHDSTGIYTSGYWGPSNTSGGARNFFIDSNSHSVTQGTDGYEEAHVGFRDIVELDGSGRGQTDFGNTKIINRHMDNVSDTIGRVALAGSHAVNNVAYNLKGVWSSLTAYVIGDEVVYGPSYWVAVAASTNSAPTIGNVNWQVVGTYSGFQGAWNSVTAYIAGAEVTYNNNYWVCLVANTNSAPTTSNANWQVAGPTNLDAVADGPTFKRVTGVSAGNQVQSGSIASGQVNDAHIGTVGLGTLGGRTADKITYVSGGATVDSLKPAEAGAEVTTGKDLNVLANRTADKITYVTGGASVDSLKPGEAGANVTETRTANDVLVGGGRNVAQAGADKTSVNTADDTSKVNGLAATSVSKQVLGNFGGLTLDTTGWLKANPNIEIYASQQVYALPPVGQIFTWEQTFKASAGSPNGLNGFGATLFSTISPGSTDGVSGASISYLIQIEGAGAGATINLYRKTASGGAYTGIRTAALLNFNSADGLTHTLKIIVTHTSAGQIDFEVLLDGNVFSTGQDTVSLFTSGTCGPCNRDASNVTVIDPNSISIIGGTISYHEHSPVITGAIDAGGVATPGAVDLSRGYTNKNLLNVAGADWDASNNLVTSRPFKLDLQNIDATVAIMKLSVRTSGTLDNRTQTYYIDGGDQNGQDITVYPSDQSGGQNYGHLGNWTSQTGGVAAFTGMLDTDRVYYRVYLNKDGGGAGTQTAIYVTAQKNTAFTPAQVSAAYASGGLVAVFASSGSSVSFAATSNGSGAGGAGGRGLS